PILRAADCLKPMTTWRRSPWPADLDPCGAWIAHLPARCPPRQVSFAHASRPTEPSMSLFNVGFVIFPELTQLDFTGPQQVLARLPQSAMHTSSQNQLLPFRAIAALVSYLRTPLRIVRSWT